MTPQEILDRAYEGVLDQGFPSVNDAGHCLYRGPLGSKCAVGHVIDDKTAFKLGLYNISSQSPVAQYIPDYLAGLDCFLGDLQEAHDSLAYGDVAEFETRWNENINDLAELYDLESPVQEYEDL